MRAPFSVLWSQRRGSKFGREATDESHYSTGSEGGQEADKRGNIKKIAMMGPQGEARKKISPYSVTKPVVEKSREVLAGICFDSSRSAIEVALAVGEIARA